MLVSWIGRTDLRAPTETDAVGAGPVAQAIESRQFDEVVLLSDYEERLVNPYLKWLRGRTKTRVRVIWEKLSGPTQFGEIYEAAVRGVQDALGERPRETALAFHLSPGTPQMAAVWILLGKTRFPAELIESSKDHGVRTSSVPFDISADFLPDLLREADERLRNATAGETPNAPEFDQVIHHSRVMSRLVQRARRVAVRNVPVLLEGESGTGKEMFARAIHRASPRRERAFIAVNCGALASQLVESELFGHERGAFTDAKQARKGHFESADGGTLFLDEVGELPLAAQVKLLRVLQEGEIVRVGSSKSIKVDVRIVAATNRTLTEESAAGRFREDLFYRLAVAILQIPPLRKRAGDVGVLVDHILGQVNQESAGEPGFKEKKLSAGARNLLLQHTWPGNVRELVNTLKRAAIWSDGPAISAEDVREAILPASSAVSQEVLGRALGNGFALESVLEEVARHYLQRAMAEAQQNKTKAAELVGFSSYQRLSDWLKKHRVVA